MKKKWFTLIEIIIVLLVFSIGIFAVLKMILHNMDTIWQLEAKSTATLLAKEWLELAYNTRDSNRISSLPWDCIINEIYDWNNEDQVCKNHFLDNKWLRKIENKKNIERTSLNNDHFGESKIYIQNNSETTKYTHSVTDQESIFSRYIFFTGLKENENTINTWYILKIESHVLYKRWSRTGEIILESFIWNY